MNPFELETAIKNIDERTQRIEQILPTLATKEQLRAAVAPLATKTEVREEGERTRRYFDAVVESLRDDIRLIADGLVALTRRIDATG